MNSNENFVHNVVSELNSLGYSPGDLIKKYPVELKKLMIAHEMGDYLLALPDLKSGDHYLMPIAIGWQLLAATWPLQASVAGIDLPPLERSIMALYAEDMEMHGSEYQIPPHMFSPTLSEYLIEIDPSAILRFPIEAITSESCCLSVSLYGEIILSIPDVYKTKEMWYTALSNSGHLYFDMSTEYQTREMLLHACKSASIYLIEKLVSREMVDQEVAYTLVSNSRLDSEAINMIPLQFRTIEFYNMAINKNPLFIKDVPYVLQTKEMVISAIKSNPMSISGVHSSWMDLEIITLAAENSPYAFQFIPEDKKKSIPKKLLNKWQKQSEEYDIPY